MIFVVLFVVFVLIGLFAALIAVVSWTQRALQRFSQVQEMRVLAKEFFVEDLAGPEAPTSDLEAAPVAEAMQEQDQPTAQRQVTEDLQDLWGGSAPREPLSAHAPSYGGLS